jgi:outer membrane protein assembly factor BamA
MVAIISIGTQGCRKSANLKVAPPPGKPIKSIDIEGAKAIKEREILSYLQVKKKDYIVEGSGYNVFNPIKDVYKAYGYYDTKITDIKAEPARKNRVKITVFIDEGDPVLVSEIKFIFDSEIQKKRK